jgi:hypothetical protein
MENTVLTFWCQQVLYILSQILTAEVFKWWRWQEWNNRILLLFSGFVFLVLSIYITKWHKKLLYCKKMIKFQTTYGMLLLFSKFFLGNLTWKLCDHWQCMSKYGNINYKTLTTNAYKMSHFKHADQSPILHLLCLWTEKKIPSLAMFSVKSQGSKFLV